LHTVKTDTMGMFDYECECGGTNCVFVGGQNGGDSNVIVEVPLNDGTTVYIKGRYESYGYVQVGDYQFYPEQFEEGFESWLSHESDDSRSKIFRAGRVWTFSYNEYDDDDDSYDLKISNCCPPDVLVITKLGKKTIEKCIRADKGLNILSDEKRKAKRAKELKECISQAQQELNTL
jgi:hypothetical protein